MIHRANAKTGDQFHHLYSAPTNTGCLFVFEDAGLARIAWLGNEGLKRVDVDGGVAAWHPPSERMPANVGSQRLSPCLDVSRPDLGPEYNSMDYADELERQAIDLFYTAADCENREIAASLYGLGEFLLRMAEKRRQRLAQQR